MKRTIGLLKFSRLIISILMIINIIAFKLIENYYELPDMSLIITLWMSLFVFMLGFQYHLEKKMGFVALFLMAFSVIMGAMTLLGFVY